MFIQIHRHLYGVGVLEAAPKHRDELNICPLATFQPSAPVMLSQESSAGTAPKAAGAGRCPTKDTEKSKGGSLGAMVLRPARRVIRGSASSTAAQLPWYMGWVTLAVGVPRARSLAVLWCSHRPLLPLCCPWELGTARQMGRSKRKENGLSPSPGSQRSLIKAPNSSSGAKAKTFPAPAPITEAVPSFSHAALRSPHRLHFDHSTITSLSVGPLWNRP